MTQFICQQKEERNEYVMMMLVLFGEELQDTAVECNGTLANLKKAF